MVRALMPRALGWIAVPGWRSTSSERTPWRLSRIEAASPTGPPPTISTATVARAPADGYTLCVGQLNSHVFGPAVYAPPYDVLADFEPVGMISISALMMVGRSDIPAANLGELIAWLKGRPQPATFATVG